MPGRRVRRPILWAAAAGLAIALAVLLAAGARVAAILVAYQAKQICSGVFVAGRDPAAVAADLAVDDLAALRHVHPELDTRRRIATAAGGPVVRLRVFRHGAGCAIVDEPAASRAAADFVADPDPATPSWDVTGPYSLAVLEPSSAPRDALTRVVDRAFAEPEPDRPRRTRAVVVIQRGRIVAERYAADVTAATPLLGWSMTKSVTSALIGILVRRGRLSLGAPAAIGEWQSPRDPRARITLDHLLRMSSGLRFAEDAVGPFSDAIRMLLLERDMAAFAVEQPLEAVPGTRWQYSSGTCVILS